MNGMWLLAEHVARELRELHVRYPSPPVEARAQFEAQSIQAAGKDPRSLRRAGRSAEIRVEGVLTKVASFWAYFFGVANTGYDDIQAAINEAEADEGVEQITFYVDSGGGMVDGLFDVLAAIEGMKKPRTVRAAYACSAAYAIAAAAGKIEATSVAASVGSIGVVSSHWVYEDLVEITSTEAPDKRPDPTTEEGKKVIRAYLDSIHELFADAIARGRGTTVEKVNADYGRGAVLLAEKALERGMVDSIATKPALRVVSGAGKASAAEPAQEIIAMDIKTLKAQHPQLCDEISAEGVEQERKRCCALVKLADKMEPPEGAAKIAHDAILAGKSVKDDEVHAEFIAASMNRRDVKNRQAESEDAGKAADGARTETPTKDMGDLVVAELENQLGKKFD